ncbi:MAG: MOSC domain-containing protein [Dehalococcoidia bacterium]
MRIGSIQRIVRYPVKSMRGEELGTAELGFQGIPGDRRYAFVQTGSQSLFPWLTARQLPQLLLYRPSYPAPSSQSAPIVETPAGVSLAVDSEELRQELEAASGRGLFLLRDHRGNYYVAPVSLFSLATGEGIASESITLPEPDRFRANLYLETEDGIPFGERRWVGRVLRIGASARIGVTEPDERCIMVNLNPLTGEASPAVFRSIAQSHNASAGVYGVVLTPGSIQPGEPIQLED